MSTLSYTLEGDRLTLWEGDRVLLLGMQTAPHSPSEPLDCCRICSDTEETHSWQICSGLLEQSGPTVQKDALAP